jgi:hypothetical protein
MYIRWKRKMPFVLHDNPQATEGFSYNLQSLIASVPGILPFPLPTRAEEIEHFLQGNSTFSPINALAHAVANDAAFGQVRAYDAVHPGTPYVTYVGDWSGHKLFYSVLLGLLNSMLLGVTYTTPQLPPDTFHMPTISPVGSDEEESEKDSDEEGSDDDNSSEDTVVQGQAKSDDDDDDVSVKEDEEEEEEEYGGQMTQEQLQNLFIQGPTSSIPQTVYTQNMTADQKSALAPPVRPSKAKPVPETVLSSTRARLDNKPSMLDPLSKESFQRGLTAINGTFTGVDGKVKSALLSYIDIYDNESQSRQ